MSIKAEIQSLSPTALLELFILDSTNLPGGSILRFHAGTNDLMEPITWQGQVYMPMPIKAEGFDVTTKGTLPRPKMSIANVNGMLSAEVRNFNDFVGCKVVRKRTFKKYLDAANFAGGENPDADPNQALPDDVWYVERKVTENRHIIEFELSSAMDLMGVQLPSRQIIQQSCMWRYRGEECGWNGGYYDKSGNATSDPAQDFCPKTLAACKARFQYSQIRFGGFPGAQRGSQ
jgi:lambda family phage minor tail protein L